MTFDELKKEADAQGYKLVKKQQHTKLLSCPQCGAKRTENWYNVQYQKWFKQCTNCQFRSLFADNKTGLNSAWNKAVEEFENGMVNICESN